MTSLYKDLEFRGILKQVTDAELGSRLDQAPLTLYAGFDPTADSLHVGSLLPLLTLRRFQLAGHHIIAVVGGATGMIGDPSGKSAERSLMEAPQIAKNILGIRSVFGQVLALDGKNQAEVLNNGDWFKDLSYTDFLRDVGKHFTINHMMGKESVRARLEDREHGISYTEFSYMLLQAYDFYFLYKNHACTLQIGGSDQWGNITAGIELIRRMEASAQSTEAKVYGLTHPLVSKADGTKFGKTEQGTVWLDAKRTSVYQFYQFFIQTADADVMAFIKYFTFLSSEEILKLEESTKTSPEKRLAQLALARSVTSLIHGEVELKRVEEASQALFGEGIKTLNENTLLEVFSGAPTLNKAKSQLGQFTLCDALVETGLCSSKGSARKDISAGGIYINNERVNDPAAVISSNYLISGSYVTLRKGKKNYYLIAFK